MFVITAFCFNECYQTLSALLSRAVDNVPLDQPSPRTYTQRF